MTNASFEQFVCSIEVNREHDSAAEFSSNLEKFTWKKNVAIENVPVYVAS